jgi:glycosyltransferase involved in cell wall biosynthesis
MHIVFIQVYPNPNPVYSILADELRQRGHTVWIAQASAQGTLQWYDGETRLLEQAGPALRPAVLRRIPLLSKLLQRLAALLFILRIRLLLLSCRPDIVQVNPAHLHWVWVLPLRMPAAMKFVLDFRQINQRDTRTLAGKLKNALANLRSQLYTRFVFHRATFLHEAGARKLLGPAWQRRASVVPLGVDARFVHLPREAPAPQDAAQQVRFVYLGRIDRVRKLDMLLAAARQVRQTSTDFELVLIGPDSSGGYYQQLLEEWQIQDVVCMHPPVPYAEVPQILAGYDVALAYIPDVPVDWHYAPTIKVLEYRALGIPIIATDNQPNREIVEEGVNGVLVKNSVESLARAMLQCMTERAVLQRYHANARQMRRGILWRDVAGMYDELYTALQNHTDVSVPNENHAS